jgi:elongator complex protein 3
MKQSFYKEITRILKKKKLKRHALNRLKIKLCDKYGLKKVPTDIEILTHMSTNDMKGLKTRLLTKPSRTLSGVAVVAVMTKPIKCPHGKCIYCPGGPESFFGDVPQSYTGHEPASMRAARAHYDSYTQVFNRLEQYIVLGHNPEKVEMIVMGGTFPSFPKRYQKEFVGYAFKAMNDFSEIFYHENGFSFMEFKEFFGLPGMVGDKERITAIHNKLKNIKDELLLEKELKDNETARIRCVALCIETRPDYCKEHHINQMLALGTTRVELGVQTIYNKVLHRIERGHSVEDSIKATQLLKDSFLKVGYHIMPGLPGSNIDDDAYMFKELFDNPDFRPDALKIYPCMVMPGTELHEQWKEGWYKPLTTEQAAKLIAQSKAFIPEYCRVMRVQRDIPTKVTSAGVDMTNLRQYIADAMEKEKLKCRCIRCREPKGKRIDFRNIKIKEEFYEASRGTEVFISAEDRKNDLLLGFCRLRKPYKPFRKEITKKSVGIRERHVYGTATGIGEPGHIQHRGLGKALLKRAEDIAKKRFNADKILIMSGIGAREYYKKLGYKKDGVYMGKGI